MRSIIPPGWLPFFRWGAARYLCKGHWRSSHSRKISGSKCANFWSWPLHYGIGSIGLRVDWYRSAVYKSHRFSSSGVILCSFYASLCWINLSLCKRIGWKKVDAYMFWTTATLHVLGPRGLPHTDCIAFGSSKISVQNIQSVLDTPKIVTMVC